MMIPETKPTGFSASKLGVKKISYDEFSFFLSSYETLNTPKKFCIHL
jgi:hypothetical protein